MKALNTKTYWLALLLLSSNAIADCETFVSIDQESRELTIVGYIIGTYQWSPVGSYAEGIADLMINNDNHLFGFVDELKKQCYMHLATDDNPNVFDLAMNYINDVATKASEEES